MRRHSIALLTAALALAGLGGTAQARTPDVRTYAYGARASAPQIAQRLGQSPAGFTGGPTTAADGETVNVFVQDELLATDPSAVQRWADTVAGLLHGPEIGEVTLYIATLARVTQICGSGALGCYGGGRLVAMGQDFRDVTALSVITHEYGHHVADSRLNDPWPAVDWGTKRWASYEFVCSRAQNGQLFPGNEDRFYQFNPGEAFAETYRVLNERRAGIPESGWDVVDQSLYPDQTALDLVARDVSDPWTGNTTTAYTSSVGPRATGRGFRVPTPYDGNFTVTLTGPAKARLTLRIVDVASGKVLAADATSLRVKTLDASVCGPRTLQVQVKRVSGSGSFRLAVSEP